MNVEDTRLGVAEYLRKKHNLETIELMFIQDRYQWEVVGQWEWDGYLD